jgi:AcrR family transcriptional regulator
VLMDQKAASRMERKKEETKNKIITVAVDLFHAHGLEAVTMEQIAEAADIAKGTLYNYFPSKDAIIAGFLQRTARERNPDRLAQIRQLPDTRARMIQVFGLLVERVQAQKEIFEAFMVYRMKQVISFRPVEGEPSGLSELVREIIQLGQQTGDLRTDLPDDMLEGLFEYALIAAIKPFYLDPATFNAQESIERSVDLFLNGAKA